MKRALLAMSVLLVGVLPCFAADGAKMKGASGTDGSGTQQYGPPTARPPMMPGMMRNPQHQLMMAYHKNVMIFSRALERVAEQGDMVPPDFARTAVAEMKRSTDEMEKYRAGAMATIPAEMRTAEMKKRMDEHLVNVKNHLRQLEDLVKSDRIPSAEVLKHLRAINEGCDGMSCDLMHRRGMYGSGMHGRGMHPCGCEQMTPEHHQVMHQMTEKLRAQDDEMLRRVEKMKRAPRDERLDLLAGIVASMVQQRAEMTTQMERMQKKMMDSEGESRSDRNEDDMDDMDMDY